MNENPTRRGRRLLLGAVLALLALTLAAIVLSRGAQDGPFRYVVF